MQFGQVCARIVPATVAAKRLWSVASRMGLAMVWCCLVLPGAARAEVTSVWENNCNGQAAGDCNSDGSTDWWYPNNDNWSQQATYGGWPCDTQYTVMLAPSNWSTACYPANGNCGETYDVIITAAGPTQMDVSANINRLTIQPGGLLNIYDARALGIMTDSVLSNAGTLVINPQTCCSETRLDINANVTLQGGGLISLPGASTRSFINAQPGVVLTQATDHSIVGMGVISARLANAGLLNANAGGWNSMSLVNYPMSNTGTFRASNESFLDINAISVSQTGSGRLLADPGIVRILNGGSVVGGTLTSANGGYIHSLNGNNTLTNVTLSSQSQLDINDASVLSLTGTHFVNNGLLRVSPQTCCSETRLDVLSNLSLEGTGRIELRGSDSRAWLKAEPGITLSQAATHTISGLGQISASLANAGLVNANWGGWGMLRLFGNPMNNGGIFRASQESYLDINGITVTQSDNAVILADPGVVRINGGTNIIGGKLTSANGGYIFNNGGNNTLTDVTLTSGSQLDISDATIVSLAGTRFTNNGLVRLDQQTCCSETRLDITSNLSLEGSGRLEMRGDSSRAWLKTNPGVTLTHTATHTISGLGWITANLVNAGTINANWGGWSWLSLYGEPKLNTGLMKASTESILGLSSMTLTQTGTGTILADGGQVCFNGDLTIDGGTLTTTNGGVIVNRGGTNTLKNVRLSTGSALNVNDATAMNLTGTALVNDGTILLDPQACCSRTPVDVVSNLALQGTGTFRLNGAGSRAQLNTADGVRVANTVTHSIRGYGEITAALDNAGLIEADVPGNRIYLDTRDKTNSGTIRANGGELEISAITLSQTPSGEIVTAGNNAVLSNGTNVIGGTLRRTGGSGTFIALDCKLTNVTLAPQTYLELYDSRTLTLTGSTIVNDGQILVNPQACCSLTQLLVDGNVSLIGTGRVTLNGWSSRARIATTAGSLLTQAAGHGIDGLGEINAAFNNAGVVNASVADNVLRLHDQPKTNSGLMKSSGGGVLDIGATTLTQTGTGLLMADGGRVRFTGDGFLIGGTIAAANGGGVDNVSGTNTFQNVTIAAGTWLGIYDATALNVIGSSLVNNGTIYLDVQACCSRTPLNFNSSVILSGSGDIQLNGGDNRAQINVAGGELLAIAAGQRIHGLGQINGALVNSGSIIADVNHGVLTINASGLGLANNGTLGSANGGILIINGPASTGGAVFAGPGSTTNAQAGTIQTTGTTTVDGTLNVSGDGNYTLAGGTLLGGGVINGNLLNSGGVVSPGHPLGTLSINGVYTQSTGGTLHIDITGPDANQMDELAVSGAVNLGGTLDVTLLQGFKPRPGQRFVIVSGNNIIGTFDNSIIPAGFELIYEREGAGENPPVKRVVLVSTTVGTGFARPDFNQDYGVDQLDVQALKACFSGPKVPYAAGCAGKDLDNDGDVDMNDYGLLQRCYSGPGMADANCGW